MKHVTEGPFTDAEVAALQLVQLASGIKAVQDGRIHIEKINYPFLYTLKASGAEFGAGIRCAVEKGWLELHESGTYVRLLTPARICCRRLSWSREFDEPIVLPDGSKVVTLLDAGDYTVLCRGKSIRLPLVATMSRPFSMEVKWPSRPPTFICEWHTRRLNQTGGKAMLQKAGPRG
ncbi:MULTISPECIES: hypothetical protein [Bradyrhizobium]|uniref:hypothetical protein n=1 Tax=Bradyrhizobium TaxID=374 RepID=UPI00293E5EEC|nr:hypothetical protein [Bradyrhizobium sp. BWC-3-1]WOH60229.1 hypothetical protein RX329_09005 [Bradyrhizobium sp. BWC-3-1]